MTSVFELMIDPDMTTRSSLHSYGLYVSRERAMQQIKRINPPPFAAYEIVERTVIQ